ncbi:hypothetical protein [Andreprevotia lacus]|uniref:hypothetical protein n=1 Tax=Andreprevotia lacus TaxID=1121000 RepID=UPI00111BDD5A|nr:hypothetical protein [Andreprevotia lacus]
MDITIVWPWRRKRSISWASVSEVLLRHDGGKNVSASLVLQDGEHVALDAFAHIETLLQGAAERGIPVYRVGCWPKHGPTKPQALMVFAHGELVSQAGQLKGWHSLFAWADSSAVANDLAPEVLIAAEMLAAGLGKPCDGLPSLLANWVANAGASPDVVVDHFIPQLKNALDAMSADVAMERALYLAGLWQRLR